MKIKSSIDKEILPLVNMMRKKGIRTCASCAGHIYKSCRGAYIAFHYDERFLKYLLLRLDYFSYWQCTLDSRGCLNLRITIHNDKDKDIWIKNIHQDLKRWTHIVSQYPADKKSLSTFTVQQKLEGCGTEW